MQDLTDMLLNNPKNMWNKLTKKNKNWLEYLQKKYPFSSCLNEKLYLFAHHMDQPPVCPVHECNNQVNWINKNHYGITCSQKCSQQYKKQTGQMIEIQDKMQSTMISKYGVDNPSQNLNTIKKRNATLMQKYGALVSPKTREAARTRAANMHTKALKTIKDKYGVDNVSQIPGVQDKKVATMTKNYGVSHASQIPHVHEARLQNRINRYKDLSSGIASILSWDQADEHLQSLYKNPNPRVQFKCDACGVQDELAMETFRWRTQVAGTPCIRCSGIHKGSLQEGQIKSYLESLGIAFISNDRKQLHPHELDVYIPNHNLAIEYCGLYWHSELQGSTKTRHLDKMKACAQKGIRLITIFEDEWIHKPEVVKSRIKNTLQMNSMRLGARMFTCKKVPATTANAFCAQHHIQGVSKTNHAYGLYHADDLKAVMTFSKLSVAKGTKSESNVWELNRFCVQPDLTISGGANRLFKAFLTDQMPTQVISYSDRRWNTGQVYAQLGFEKSHDTSVNYWYIDFKSMERIHRFGLRKSSTDDPMLSEWENRKLQGWNRIWDCGSTKWIWNKKEE